MIDLIPFVANNVVIHERNGEHVLDIPADMDGLKFRNWLKKPGGIFSRDFLSWIREKSEAKYFMLRSENMQSVIRLIDKEEVIHFNSLNLLHGKIKDSYYMHLKTVGIDQNIRGNERYIDESSSTGKELNAETETNDTENDEKSYQSESLFD